MCADLPSVNYSPVDWRTEFDGHLSINRLVTGWDSHFFIKPWRMALGLSVSRASNRDVSIKSPICRSIHFGWIWIVHCTSIIKNLCGLSVLFNSFSPISNFSSRLWKICVNAWILRLFGYDIHTRRIYHNQFAIHRLCVLLILKNSTGIPWMWKRCEKWVCVNAGGYTNDKKCTRN